MKGSISLGKILGIEVQLHFTWFVIATMIGLVLMARFAEAHPQWGTAVVAITAITTALLFFVTLLMHEFSHAIVARGFKMPVHSITLFALGGVANIEKEADTPKAEFWMGIVGPITSVIIGVVCLALGNLAGWTADDQRVSPVASALAWLGYINIALAAFNMVPAFPMDGGRVLKAIVWWITKDPDRSTRIAARMGQGLGMLFIAGGVLLLLFTGSFGGLWFALIGWFITAAAGATMMQSELASTLRDVHVSDAMSPASETAPADMSVEAFVDQSLSKTGKNYFLVHEPEHPDQIVGLITPQDIVKVKRHDWPTMKLMDAMVPMNETVVAEADMSLVDALQLMSSNHVSQLPVADHGRICGVLSRDNVVQLFQNRAALGKRAA